MRKTIPFLVIAALLSFGVPASAAPPVITREHVDYTVPEAYGVSCDGFEIMFTASADHLWMDFYDDAGNLMVTTLHFSFTGTLYNSTDLTKDVPYDGRGYWTWDWADGHGIDTFRYTATIDGRRVQILTGQDVYNWDPIWLIWHGIDGASIACEALS